MSVIILSGIPGAGKTTFAEYVSTTIGNREDRAEHRPDHRSIRVRICSADDFFTDPRTGEYRFDKALLQRAHEACLRDFEACLQAATDIIFVDNTNLDVIDVAPYAALAAAHGHSTAIVDFPVDAETAWQRNKHGVPLEKVQYFFQKAVGFRRLVPKWWRVIGVPEACAMLGVPVFRRAVWDQTRNQSVTPPGRMGSKPTPSEEEILRG